MEEPLLIHQNIEYSMRGPKTIKVWFFQELNIVCKQTSQIINDGGGEACSLHIIGGTERARDLVFRFL